MITRALLVNVGRKCRISCASRLRIPPTIHQKKIKTQSTPSFVPWIIQSKRCYSPQDIESSLRDLHQNKSLAPFIRTCLPRKEECLKDDYTGFHVWFLGTGGSTPSKSRMTSATILQLGGQSLLFDVGEGFQRQLYYTRQRFTDLSKIFITHMHGDHILGLPGLLLMAQAAGRDRKYTQKIDIYGPPGLYNYIVANMMLMRATTNASEICIHELVGGTADGQLKRRMPKENIIHGDFPNLFKHKNIERKTIEPNEDGTWTIEREQEKFEDDDDVDFRRGRNRKFNIFAAEVTHINAVQTFGYTVSEPEPMRKIDAEKATKLGVAPSKKYKKLKNGFPVTSDDGLRTIQPEQVLTTTNRKQRKIAVIGDNCGLSPAMEKLCRNADVMVHEASLSIESTIVSSHVGSVLCMIFMYADCRIAMVVSS